MKNKFTVLLAILLLLTVGFGCNYIKNSGGSTDNSTKSGDGATNSADSTKTGVAECDEFLDLLNNDSKKPDEDFLTKKIREYAIDFARESIKKNTEENKGDKQKIGEGCKKAKDDYTKKKDEKNNEKPKESDKSSNTQKL